jgi:hypothetical protein
VISRHQGGTSAYIYTKTLTIIAKRKKGCICWCREILACCGLIPGVCAGVLLSSRAGIWYSSNTKDIKARRLGSHMGSWRVGNPCIVVIYGILDVCYLGCSTLVVVGGGSSAKRVPSTSFSLKGARGSSSSISSLMARR